MEMMTVIELRCGRTRATVAPAAGGRLHQLAIREGGAWLPLLRAPHEPAVALREPALWGSYAMLPWPNRIDGGRFTWRGRLYEVPANEAPHALHGLGFVMPWTVEDASRDACTLSLRFDERWPFGGSALQHLRVRDDGIEQRIELHADGAAYPAGAGWHPWFRRDVRRGVPVRVRVDADRTYETHEMIPTGWTPTASGERDLRGYPELGARRLDTCYRQPRGALRIRWGGIELAMHSSQNVTHAVVHTPAGAVCVEPQTCAVDAFNLEAQGVAGAGAIVVAPGRPLVATTRWRWRVGG